MYRTAALLVSLVSVAACTAEPPSAPALDVPEAPRLQLVSGAAGGAAHVVDTFFATATCGGDIGSIRFGGRRELVRNVSGNDTTLAFRAQAFQGWRLPETVFDQSTVDYEVLGGAEMFNIKREGDATNGPIVVRIHNGTLVFRSLADGSKIVARHVIRDRPGDAPVLSTWDCRRTG